MLHGLPPEMLLPRCPPESPQGRLCYHHAPAGHRPWLALRLKCPQTPGARKCPRVAIQLKGQLPRHRFFFSSMEVDEGHLKPSCPLPRLFLKGARGLGCAGGAEEVSLLEAVQSVGSAGEDGRLKRGAVASRNVAFALFKLGAQTLSS